MINWFDMPAEGLSNGGLFEIKELEVTENGTYETSGEMYNKVTVNVEGGGGSSDFSTAEVTFSVVNDVANAPIGIIIDNNEALLYTNGDSVIDDDKYVYVLYKGSQTVSAYDTAQITVEGNANIVEQVEDDGSWYAMINITGDCTINLTGENDA